MTNFGALAILALPSEKLLPPDLRLLVALETVPANEREDRLIGMPLLAVKAGVPYGTARRSRDRLVAAGLIAYRAGSGRGQASLWRILFDLKVPAYSEHLSGGRHGRKVPAQGEHLSNPKGAHSEPERCSLPPKKGAHQNSVTSENENTGLQPSGLQPSGLLKKTPKRYALEKLLDVYPEPGDQLVARRAWGALMQAGEDPDKILAAARDFARQVTDRQLPDPPYLGAWLANRWWEMGPLTKKAGPDQAGPATSNTDRRA